MMIKKRIKENSAQHEIDRLKESISDIYSQINTLNSQIRELETHRSVFRNFSADDLPPEEEKTVKYINCSLVDKFTSLKEAYVLLYEQKAELSYLTGKIE